MEHPAVSVIIPVWNSGKYFRECLDSVLSQSLRNIEVLIVDDASTDGSGAVAEEYASRDARITVMHQPSSTGAGPARNRAMAVARGEYIAFMDSDDLYPSNDVLETLYRKAVEQNVNICGGSLLYINSDGSIRIKQISYQMFNRDSLYMYKDYQYEGGFYRFIYNRKFLNDNNIIFCNYKRFQDSVFFVCCMTFAKSFYAISKNVYFYRKGHKDIIWDYSKLHDHLCGVNKLLITSKKYSYNYLYYELVKNIYFFIDKINRFDLFILFIKIYYSINFEIINQERYRHKFKIYRVKFYIKILKMVYIILKYKCIS
ncbi:glycosyltransferase family 2 protein [Mailhella massiliensis]|uniref:glycosyltransferase family 2 protein n=1 Tax=Mailhella massiliensis TaxID=1903261 RepID=UPI00097D5F0F|nr:glycosyltransferase family 2 protein [Mailhella massiliensis]